MTCSMQVNHERQGDVDFSEVLPDRFNAHKIRNERLSNSLKNYNKTISV